MTKADYGEIVEPPPSPSRTALIHLRKGFPQRAKDFSHTARLMDTAQVDKRSENKEANEDGRDDAAYEEEQGETTYEAVIQSFCSPS